VTKHSPRHIPRPRPDLVRRPVAGFGWLDDAILHDGWLSRLGTNAVAVLVLLAMAADQHGASFFSRHRMADTLALSIYHVEVALQRLRDLELVDFAPWRPGCRDGVWQLLAPPAVRGLPRDRRLLGAAEILASLGLTPPDFSADLQRRTSTPSSGAE
jgi:hypothetical protein